MKNQILTYIKLYFLEQSRFSIKTGEGRRYHKKPTTTLSSMICEYIFSYFLTNLTLRIGMIGKCPCIDNSLLNQLLERPHI